MVAAIVGASHVSPELVQGHRIVGLGRVFVVLSKPKLFETFRNTNTVLETNQIKLLGDED
jgi:hypothetical protein